jgi:dynactin complex subunit
MTSRGARAGKPQVGQRCALTEHNGEQATIRFVGTTKFAPGIWVSLLQKKKNKNKNKEEENDDLNLCLLC